MTLFSFQITRFRAHTAPILPFEEPGEVLGIVAANSEDATLPVDHDAIPAHAEPFPCFKLLHSGRYLAE